MAAKEKTIVLAALKLNEQNPRRISDEAFETLKRSIKRDPEFMRLRPIIVDEENMIIGGNQRYRALLALKKKVVPAAWVVKAKGLTEEQRRRFVLLDNSPEGMAGYWDFQILQLNYDTPMLIDMGFKFLEKLDFEKIWAGMPTYENEDKTAFRSIIVHFKNQKSVDGFAKAIKQKVSKDAKYIWFPRIEIERLVDKRYSVEP